jgi:prolyl oligopeptidase
MDLPGHAAVYYHRLGTDPREDRLVREKTGDPRTFIHAEISRDGRYLLLFVQFGWTNVDVYFQDLRASKPQWMPLAVGTGSMFSAVAHRGFFYILTNLDAPNYRLFKVDPQKPGLSYWKEIVAQRSDAVIEDFSVVGNHLALTLLTNASSRVIVTDLEGKNARELELPGIGTTGGLVGHPEDDRAFFSFSSFTQPPVVYETSVKALKSKVFFEVKLPFDPHALHHHSGSLSVQRRHEHHPVPDSQAGLQKNGDNPFLLYGYGGFT